jgi:subtilase family serine protease
MTVAVVDAYDLPTAEADLAFYRSYWGMPACTTANGCFRKLDQNGGTAYPTADPTGWGVEIALDLDMVSAACPYCNIVLIEADDSSYSNLGPAVDTAVSLGAVAVSNSYGGPEWSDESSFDSHYNHPGVAIVASTGDCGYHCASSGYNSVEYPAASQFVVAVGGTSLTPAANARGYSESAWSGAGSGCAAYEPKPSWQQDTGCSNRTEADVSAVADPQTGVWVRVNGGWGVYGGTSAAAPIIASVFALANGHGATPYPASNLYAGTAHLNDVVGGNNDIKWHSCTVTYLCNGVVGYDGPTGLGTPAGTIAFNDPKSSYVPLNPTRLLDTRIGMGLSGTFGSHVARTFAVAGGSSGVPGNATAVTGNLTVTAQTAVGYLYVGPVAMNYPTSSTLNFPLGDDRANAVTVALGSGGTLSVTYVANGSSATTHVVFDVTGYFTPDTTGATYIPLNPTRLLDTRDGTGLSGTFGSHVARTFAVSGGTSGVPGNATAVTGNLTVTGQTAVGYLYMGPVAMNYPTSSTLNFPLGDDRANAVTVALGSGGTLSVTYVANGSSATTHVVFDVTGYFTPGTSGAMYVPLNPTRLLDTRVGTGLSGVFGSHSARSFQVSGGTSGVPGNATAVTGNLTVTGQTALGYLYMGPVALNYPTSSTLNFPLGDDRANAVTVALGSGGTLSVTYVPNDSSATTHVVFDVTGYFVP